MDATKPVKDFTKTTEVLPFTKFGLSTCGEFQGAEAEIQGLEHLKKVGLTEDEIKLYQDHKAGTLEKHTKVEKNILQDKLNAILEKISSHSGSSEVSSSEDVLPSTSNDTTEKLLQALQRNPTKFYPEGHPMNEIKELEDSLFKHLKDDNNMMPINKRRKIMRRLERKQEQALAQEKEMIPCAPQDEVPNVRTKKTLWDVKHLPKERPSSSVAQKLQPGPQIPAMYTIKDNKILRLEPTEEHETGEQDHRAVEIVVPINEAEENLLEGTKISVDHIRKIDRFKDYEPGIPSKVLYLKNLSPSVTQEQVSILFNQFVSDNEALVEVRLMTGRMRGQAFIAFQHEHVAIQALEEINGTVLSGRPIIAEFGRNSNRIQVDDDR